MARRKTKKLAVKQQTTNNMITTIKKMEQDFLKTPTRLASQLDKEIGLLKQKDNKVKKALNKIKGQVINSEKRLKAAKQQKNTSAGKKQFKLAKKLFDETISTQSGLLKQAQEITKSLDTIIETQARLIAMRKHINQFQKNWVKEAKQVKSKLTSKPKTKKIAKTKTLDIIATPKLGSEAVETEQVMFDEVNEVTS